jgi:Zn-dependent peptidase ImmA (M78 family)
VLAQANSEARRVYVLWDRIGPAVDRQAIAHGDALGLVIAHELGHVLLPGRGHSRSGIMQANYDVFLSYRLKFTAEESAAMRAFIASTRR